ncbi:siderophore ferric iron reductase [Paraburkholderia antibiotica]|uniref:Siderophore ferric iron reductase n=1 Tax=Paraburkholderia antibiotica TaxID=2728839 RepID=A0A7X9ZX29_9BURK|nr:siderophore ferric iron reductase [Paraburkholderia antibiotica]NML31704.1 siderophore ferric iron reductase [Paraburkholderia antibiotica]
MTARPALDHLLRLAASVVPGLRGVVADGPRVIGTLDAIGTVSTAEAGRGGVAQQRPAADDGNRAALEALLAHWTDAYPEAGRAYWSLRCWGILIWQPIYLSVIGAHTTQRVLSLARFEQPIENGWTREVRVPAHEPAQAEPAALIELTAREIVACCTQSFDDLSRVIRVNPIAAAGMQADCVLAALLAVRAVHPEWDHAHVEALGERWLAALSLDGRGGFFAYTRSDRSSALALDRQTCCYHYRRRDGELCSTCPRLQKCERIARLNAEHDAAAAA